jgi:diaminopimelate decarboxylase
MKKPFVTLEQLKEIVTKYPTPFHIYDEKGIRENARRLYKAFAWNKGFKEYFAVKATPNPYIVNILKEEGCGVDCSSLTELMLSKALGFAGNEIMFSSNATPPEEFIKAKELNAIINLDDITHIDFLEKVAGLPETICCRYNPGGVFCHQ